LVQTELGEEVEMSRFMYKSLFNSQSYCMII